MNQAINIGKSHFEAITNGSTEDFVASVLQSPYQTEYPRKQKTLRKAREDAKNATLCIV